MLSFSRNKFCGLCNGKDFTQFTSWKVEVACHDLIDVQIDDSEFLQTVTEQRCNVFYWPPTNIPTVECKMPVYSISTCNETGYWLEYNETIDRACDSFLDPFNLTYKNYFCYLCNKYETGETGTCKLTQDIQSVTPPFSALLGVGGVHGEESEEQLSCDVLKQFSDDKMVRYTYFVRF